ncbi:MAG: gluconate 2-dehydrogenase subunit 3 family protein [Verrucomicrobiae bacterium]|nr:gluconate 2-dehydrogenase subunit 3 family protein [Verrucomicrobiae bacterium]
MDLDLNDRLPRRTVLRWFAASAAAGAIPSGGVLPFSASAQEVPANTPGYGTDPNLVKAYEPGDVWPLTFSEDERKLVTVLADTVLPDDEYGPAASTVRVADYVDEWVSAPYPGQRNDRKTIVPGLAKFEEAAKAKYGKPFAELSIDQRNEFCESIASDDKHPLGNFFHKFTMIAAGAYYSTMPGWKAIGYTGNTALPTFDGPPPEVLDKVGVEQTVV